VRPHSSLGYLTPNEFASQQANAAAPDVTGRVAWGLRAPARCAIRLARGKRSN
jgi:hypothetical protein